MSPGQEDIRAAIVVVPGVPRPLTYSFSPAALHIEVGSEVLVEVGSRQTQGYVIEELPLACAIQRLQTQRPDNEITKPQLSLLPISPTTPQLKPILSAHRAFLPDQLKLFEWMAQYYGVVLAEVIENALPKRSEGRVLSWILLAEHFSKMLRSDTEILTKLQRRSPVQAQVLNELSLHPEGMTIADLEIRIAGARSAISALRKKGFIEEQKVPAYFATLKKQTLPSGTTLCPEKQPNALTRHQVQALAEISAAVHRQSFTPILLHGVTGSGKTEVYLRAIEKVLADGGSALVVVPEIALTPQLLDQFESRLRQPMALLHSQVGASERWGAWEALLRGELRVAIGARSAIFAPMNELRLIIVDEEHESSYKQSDGLRYHGRDVAVMRAKFASCPVVLGSATPSFESLLNASRGRYHLIEMPERVSTRPLPSFEIVDLSAIRRKDMPSPNVSPQLYRAIQETLEQKGQVVILYNRRGFSSYLQCESCAQVLLCPNCSVALTYHQRPEHPDGGKLICHYCGMTRSAPRHCVYCRDPETSWVETDEHGEAIAPPEKTDSVGHLVHRGAGTERVVNELSELFPNQVILRMDRDSVGQKDSYRRILGEMRSGRADILVGTQMVAKGHDLPGVTLVGIIDADVGLHLPDFRASEKAYQLITQAAGRSGRGEDPGRVIVQTREPNHPTIVAIATGRFRAFARYELDFRKKLGYPPWGRLLRSVISSTDRQEALHASERVRAEIDHFKKLVEQSASDQKNVRVGTAPRIVILGPSPAPHEKLLSRYRFHIIVKSGSAKTISTLAAHLNEWRGTVKEFRDFRLAIDVDPVDML